MNAKVGLIAKVKTDESTANVIPKLMNSAVDTILLLC